MSSKDPGKTYIWGNDLADAAAMLAVTDYDTLLQEQVIGIEIGAVASKPPLWVMYTTKHATPPQVLATGARQATLDPPWWTIPEADRLQMNDFTRPSQ